MKKVLYAFAAVLAMTACNKDRTPDVTTIDMNGKDDEAKAVVTNLVEKTIIPTYTTLGDEATKLQAALVAFKAAKTQAALDAILPLYKSTRQAWEQSEAFLYGPAGDFEIDGHIDDWPFDFQEWPEQMKNSEVQAALASNDLPAVFVKESFASIVGFHAIEYVCFKDGKAREVSELGNLVDGVSLDNIANYLVAVGQDLLNHCYELQVSWEKDPQAVRLAAVKAAELEYRVRNLDVDYSTSFTTPGNAKTSAYSNWGQVFEEILQGCIDICSEVGDEKIGYPYGGHQETAGIDYIESPYSWNSIADFYNNITSIKHVYEQLTPFISKYAPALDEQIQEDITKALSEIGPGLGENNKTLGGMAYPFVKNAKDASVKEAIEAVSALADDLEKAVNLFK